jgi:hypothetical protein
VLPLVDVEQGLQSDMALRLPDSVLLLHGTFQCAEECCFCCQVASGFSLTAVMESTLELEQGEEEGQVMESYCS